MNTILFIGMVLIVAGAALYVWQNPQVLGKFSQQLRRSQQQVEAAKQAVKSTSEVPDRPASSETTLSTQFADLRAGEFVEFTTRSDGLESREHQVTATGTFQALNRTGQSFHPRGEAYPVYVLDDEFWVVERLDGWFAFTSEEVLQGEAAKWFNPYGEEFGAKGQQPGSVRFERNGQLWSIQDTGYMRFELAGGRCDLGDGAMVKYLLASLGDGNVAMLVNQKSGSDWIWYGQSLGHDLEPYLGKVIRAA